jgi:hypothetical protein
VTFGVWPAAGFEQEPGAPFGFIYPDLDETRRRDVTVLVAHAVDFAQTSSKPLVVLAKLGEHVGGLDVDSIVVEHALRSGNVTYGAQCQTTDLPNTFGDSIRHRE